MKKRMVSLCLSLLLVLSMVPTAAFAASTVSAPANPQWGRWYSLDIDKYETVPGLISWQIPQGETAADYYQYKIYKKGDTSNPIYTNTFQTTIEATMNYKNFSILDGLNVMDVENGTYYFTVQAVTADKTPISDLSTSPEFTYTKPSSQVAAPSAPVWDGTKVSFTPPSEKTNSIGYEVRFYFSSDKDNVLENTNNWINEIVFCLLDEELDFDEELPKDVAMFYMEDGLNYCNFRIRTLSKDFTANQNSEWSEYSDVIDLRTIWGETPITYTLTYNLNGASGTAPTGGNYQAEAKVTLSDAPTRIGYTFSGWSDGTTTYQAGESYTMPSKDVTLTAVWSLNVIDIESATVVVEEGPHAYTGSPITPEVTVKLGQTTLVKDTDYTVAYTNNTNVGKATVTITGKGNTGTKTAEFDITKAELAVTADSYLKNTDGVLTLDLDKVPGMPSGETFVYEAAEGQTPTGFTPALTEKTLTLTANGSGTVGGKETYRVNAASANYSVTITVEVAYTDKDVKEIKAPAVTPSVTYNGKPAQVYTGTASVDGVPDVEFTVTYAGVGETEYDASATAPTNAGRYTVTFALKNEEDFVANPVVQPFAITKATPTFTAPTSAKLTAAAQLRTVALTGGEVKGVDQAVIPGTFAWSGDTSVNVEKGTEYPWGFTPTTPDANYDFSAVTGKLTPWVSSGGGSGGNSGGGGGTAKPPVKDPEPPTTPETPPTTSSNFADVPSDAYYADAVAWAVSKGITTGTGDGKFSPAAPCTRAQVVTFLWRAAGSPAPSSTASFADVPADAYYRDAVLWAVEKGITNGTGADAFSPDATVDRAQTVTFLYRYAGSPAASGGDFQDVASGSYYADAVAWAVSQEITNGTSPTTFAPASNCTRGQTVTFLFRALAQ